MNNIENYKKRFYNLMESTVGDVKPINEVVDSYSDIEFRDGVVGNSKPSKDNIDTTLLSDIQKACEISGVKVAVTTAVSGHKKGTRHEHGFAVDIAQVYDDKGVPQGFSGVESAKKRGVYDKIMAFVSALESMGYNKNVREKGNPKVVLTFGFPEHHHHIHVSNVENRRGFLKPKNKTTVTPKEKEIPAKIDTNDSQVTPTKPLSYYMREAQKLLNMPEEEQDGKFGKNSLQALKDFIAQNS